MCESIGLCAYVVLLPYLRYSKEWVEIRDILFFDMQSSMLANLYEELFPNIASCSVICGSIVRLCYSCKF